MNDQPTTTITIIERDEHGHMTYAEGRSAAGWFSIEVEGSEDGIRQLRELGFTNDQILAAARNAHTVVMGSLAEFERAIAEHGFDDQEEQQ